MAEPKTSTTTETAAAAAANPTASTLETTGGNANGAPVIGTEEVKIKSGEYVQAIGPSDPSNNAAALRFTPVNEEGEAQETIQIHRGQRLKVGTAKDADLTIAQAKTLMGLGIWSFQKVEAESE